jgi:hypothetical protein
LSFIGFNSRSHHRMSELGQSQPTNSTRVPAIICHAQLATEMVQRRKGREVPIATGAPQKQKTASAAVLPKSGQMF